MDEDKLLLGIAIIAVLVSAVGLAFTYSTVSEFNGWLTGFVIDTATANVTIDSNAIINFTTDNINWGSGTFSAGVTTNATLRTDGTNNTRGSWANVTQGFILENIGNVNVTLNITTVQDAASFIGGTSPRYQYNVTNNEPGSCLNSSGGTDALGLGIYTDANSTQNLICPIFNFADGSDEIRIDLLVVIPVDAIGTKGDIITATVTALS